MKSIRDFYAKIEDKDGRAEVASSLKAMLNSQGWKIMEVLLKDKEHSLQEKVNDISLKGDEDLMRARVELFYLRQFIKKPHDVVESLSRTKDSDDTQEVYE